MRVLGLDLGQANDPAAAALIDRVDREPVDFIGPPSPAFRVRLAVRSLRLWPLGTDYTEIVDDVLKFPSVNVLLVDFGGVGRGVVDVMRRRAMALKFKGKIKPVQLIGSNARATRKQEPRGEHWNVPKIDVITSILLAQQDQSLRLVDSAETKTLMEQLRIFQMKITKAANLQFGNAPGGHDDLITALGLCCWWCRKFGNMKPAVWC